MLLYAFTQSAEDHARYRGWLEKLLAGPATFGIAELTLSAFVRIATHPRIYDPPATLDEALAFADALRGADNVVMVQPGNRHWEIFSALCRAVRARGNLVPDAYFAALAIETGGEWVTTDRDFARFPGLKWRHPLE